MEAKALSNSPLGKLAVLWKVRPAHTDINTCFLPIQQSFARVHPYLPRKTKSELRESWSVLREAPRHSSRRPKQSWGGGLPSSLLLIPLEWWHLEQLTRDQLWSSICTQEFDHLEMSLASALNKTVLGPASPWNRFWRDFLEVWGVPRRTS